MQLLHFDELNLLNIQCVLCILDEECCEFTPMPNISPIHDEPKERHQSELSPIFSAEQLRDMTTATLQNKLVIVDQGSICVHFELNIFTFRKNLSDQIISLQCMNCATRLHY